MCLIQSKQCVLNFHLQGSFPSEHAICIYANMCVKQMHINMYDRRINKWLKIWIDICINMCLNMVVNTLKPNLKMCVNIYEKMCVNDSVKMWVNMCGNMCEKVCGNKNERKDIGFSKY